MSNERAKELIKKYLDGNATPDEEALLQSWYLEAARDQPGMADEPDYPKIGDEILQKLRAEQGQPNEQAGVQAGLQAQGQLHLQAQGLVDLQPQVDVQAQGRPPSRLWLRVAAAAAILIALSIGTIFIFHKTPAPAIVKVQPVENDILPAGTKATLTLLDGKTIPLDSTSNSTIARQGNATIQSLNGQLIYSPGQTGTQAPATAFNTLTTKPGEHYSLVLPDGTKAWLNAGSSITYPIAFTGSERRVTVTGELYLEIVHNTKQPFRIAAKDETVEDIGTQLNINAYDDEPVIKTTLLEGRVSVVKGTASATLTPGHQATIGPADKAFRIKEVDANAATAWKNGYFYFDHADIQTVMREMARWYNVQVKFNGEFPKTKFKGKVYRNINASEALKILSYFGAHFQIEGRTITVSA
jgi:transmembrane sensor